MQDLAFHEARIVSSVTTPDLRFPSRRGPFLSGATRAALLLVAWLPFVVSLLFYLPRFAPIYDNWDRLGQGQEPPWLATWLLLLARLNAGIFGLPILAFLLLLLLVDVVLARVAVRQK